jgi:hypothetical protein
MIGFLPACACAWVNSRDCREDCSLVPTGAGKSARRSLGEECSTSGAGEVKALRNQLSVNCPGFFGGWLV